MLVNEGAAHALEILIGHQTGFERVIIAFGRGAMLARAVVRFAVTVVIVVVMIVGFTATAEEQAAGNEGHRDELEQGLHFHVLILPKGMRERQKFCRLRGGYVSRPFPLLFHRCYGSKHGSTNMADFTLENYARPTLETPNGEQRILMHSCCAPCSGEVMDAMAASGIETTIFFYNPNIHPRTEYELRKEENIRYAEKLGMEFVDADYDTDNWFERVRGLEQEPERGARCTVCFDMRFERTALYAAENGFNLISSTLGISRWKNMDQINASGTRAAARWEDMTYWTFNWRKQGGAARMIELSKREEFYQQEYCGCVYSLRDTNDWRQQNSREKIERGVKFYGKGDVDGESCSEE